MLLLFNTLQEIKCLQSVSKRACYTFTITVLQQIYSKLQPLHSQDVDPSMLWAAFTLAFFRFLQSIKFTWNGKFDPHTHLSRADIIFKPNIFSPNFLEITIRSPKLTPSTRQPNSLLLGQTQHLVHPCPLRLSPSNTHSQITSHPLVKLTDRRNVTCTPLTNNLRPLLHVCGLDSANFTPHNFCIGAAATGAAGLPDWLIKVFGRWKFDAHQTYINTPKEAILQVPKNLASCLT